MGAGSPRLEVQDANQCGLNPRKERSFMKRFVIAMVSVATLLVGAGSSLAQTDTQTAVLEISRADIQADRKALVAANLPLTEEQGAAFWPVYREYRLEMDKVADGVIALITNYAKNYATLDDKQATGLVKEFLDLQKDSGEVKKKYVGKFSKVLPGKSLMRFYQIENKLDTIVMAAVAGEIPLVK